MSKLPRHPESEGPRSRNKGKKINRGYFTSIFPFNALTNFYTDSERLRNHQSFQQSHEFKGDNQNLEPKKEKSLSNIPGFYFRLLKAAGSDMPGMLNYQTRKYIYIYIYIYKTSMTQRTKDGRKELENDAELQCYLGKDVEWF